MAAPLFVSPHKNKGYFFQPGRPVFIIVINTSCLGVCYRIYARQKFLNNALAPDGTQDIHPAKISNNARGPSGARALLRNFCRPTWLKEISLYFYEVTQRRTPPYCFECMIDLVKADDFTTNIKSSNSKQHSSFFLGFRSLHTSGFYNSR